MLPKEQDELEQIIAERYIGIAFDVDAAVTQEDAADIVMGMLGEIPLWRKCQKEMSAYEQTQLVLRALKGFFSDAED